MNNSTSSEIAGADGLFAWAFIFGVVSIAVVSGNAIIITAFGLNTKLLHMRTNYFLVSLAVADLLVGAFSIPMYVYDIFTYLESRRSRLHTIYNAIDIFTSFASIFALVLIALERAYSVNFPHKHRLLNQRIYFLLIMSAWVAATWLGILRLVAGYQSSRLLINIFSYVMMACIFVSLALISSSYVSIWHRVRNPVQSLHRTRSAQEKRLAKTLTIVTCVFFLSWLPFYLINITIFFCPDCYHLQIVYCSKLLHFSNSIANVLIYTLRINEFKHTVMKIFCQHRPHLSIPPRHAHRYGMECDTHAPFHEIKNDIHLLNVGEIDTHPSEHDLGDVSPVVHSGRRSIVFHL
ncbi:adenosine receptor A2a [Nematostella vectensis]|uniref:adenosine receptor A2a n=1 Tax=Nematostella vectensis TaxID=45351 RepID=UPI00138FE4DE|nr:adenosine receptor A2a [Nematostella vectensis]